MPDLFQLVGKEQRQYIKDGQQRFYCGLHLVSAGGATDGVEGSSVEKISCPREVDPSRLQIGQWYQIQYSHYRTINGMAARVSGLTSVEVE